MDYVPNEIEKKWQRFWAEQQVYSAENNSQKPKFYVLDMFPYPSGAGLHVGHPLGYIASDIYARYMRHRGHNVLHPMGYDSFGLPAEQYAIQTGQHPEKTTEENIARYREQLDKIGFSFDWSREVRTSDPKFYRWTQWIFIQLFHAWYNRAADKAQHIDSLIAHFEDQGTQNLNAACSEEMAFSAEEWKSFDKKKQSEILLNYRLAYRSESMVNWCPALGTVLANDEVKDGYSERGGHPVVQKKMMQWSLRISAYAQRLLDGLEKIDWSESIKESQRNWIGRSKGASVFFETESGDKIEVFTTRPDTLFGVSFMVLAPEHELVAEITTNDQREAVQAYQAQAAKRSERDRMADTKTVTGQFTGAYALHPFSGKKLPIYIADYVLAGYGTGAIMAVPGHDSRDWAFAKKFGLDIIEVVSGGDVQSEAFEAKEGTLVNSDFLDGLQVPEAIARAISELEQKNIGKGKTTYRLRDAIFGRQRYWGEPIPVFYDEDGIPHTLPESALPLELPPVDKYLPTEDGEPPLARAKDWVYEASHPLETTTMPGWAGSSWYFLRYMDPHNPDEFVSKEAEQYWQNVDLYMGGSEHATGHLLYARFWQKFLFDLGFVSTDEPFKKLINQGMIQGVSHFIHRLNLPEIGDSKNVLFMLPSHKFDIYKSGEVEGYVRRINEYCFKILKCIPEESYLSKPFTDSKLHIPLEFVVPDNESSPYIDLDTKEGVINWLMKTYDVKKVISLDEVPLEIEVSKGFLLSAEPEKMSKSKYNVVNPDDIVDTHGADALRMYEMFLGPLEQSKPWNTRGLSGVSSFLKKLWRLFHHAGHFSVSDEKPSEKELKALHTCIKKVNEDIVNFSFNTSVSAFMICVNELTDLKCHKREILEPLVVLLSPFAPHIAEELWYNLRHAGKDRNSLSREDSVTLQPYPKHEEKYLVESAKDYPVSFNGKVRFQINLPLSLNPKQVEEAVMADERTQKQLDGKSPRKVIVVPGRIVNIVV